MSVLVVYVAIVIGWGIAALVGNLRAYRWSLRLLDMAGAASRADIEARNYAWEWRFADERRQVDAVWGRDWRTFFRLPLLAFGDLDPFVDDWSFAWFDATGPGYAWRHQAQADR